jgi:hypothetical protein
MTGAPVPELTVVVPARDAAATIDGQLEALLSGSGTGRRSSWWQRFT